MNNTFTCSRTFPYSPEKVFSKYSNPDALTRWWGPKGFTNTFHEFDFRVGGRWIFTMHSPEGIDYANEQIFHKIEKNHIIMEHTPEPHFSTEVIIEKVGDNQAKMTWIATFESTEFLEKMRDFLTEKNNENFDRLEAELQNF